MGALELLISYHGMTISGNRAHQAIWPVEIRQSALLELQNMRIVKRQNQDSIKVTILNKGLYPMELKKKHFNRDNEYGITLVSLDPDFHQEYEPFSPMPDKRLKALRKSCDAGLKTRVSLELYPTPDIIDQDLDALLESINFVNKINFGIWNYNPEINGYAETKQFYTESADSVVEFCRFHGIKLHVKEHNPRSDSSVEGIFNT